MYVEAAACCHASCCCCCAAAGMGPGVGIGGAAGAEVVITDVADGMVVVVGAEAVAP
jgi:hypothetical protein